jgi:transcriptional regulator with XRE-family HTH domain
MRPTDSQATRRRVGRRIAELRRHQQLTQAQLAERADVSVRYLQSVELGKENLTLDSMVQFANLLRAPLLELFKPPSTRKVKRGRPPKATSSSD